MTTLASLVLATVCGLPLLILIWILSRTSSSSKRDSAADSSSSHSETDGGGKNRQEGVYEKEEGGRSGLDPCDGKGGAGRPQGVLGDINSNIPLSKHLAGVTRARDPGQKYNCDNGSVAGDIRRLRGTMGNTQEGETSSHHDEEEVEATEQQTPLTSTPLNKQLKPISGGLAASRRSGDGQSSGAGDAAACDAKVKMRGEDLQEMSPITESSISSVKGGKDSSDSVVCEDTFVMHSDASLLGSSPGRGKDQEKCHKCKEAGFSSSLVREARNAMQEKYEDYCRFLREQLDKEGRERERAQEWSEFLCLELDAHINARIHAEDKYSQLWLRSKYLSERYKRMQSMYSSLKKELDSLVCFEPTNKARCSGDAQEVTSDVVERKENPVLCLPPSTEECSGSHSEGISLDTHSMEDISNSEDQSHSGEPCSSEIAHVNCGTDNDVLIVVTENDSSVQETPQIVHQDTQEVYDDLKDTALSETFEYEDDKLLSRDAQTAPASADQLLAAYEAEAAGDSDIDDLVEIAKAVSKQKAGLPKKKSPRMKRKHELPLIRLSQSTSQSTLSEPSFDQEESASDMSEEMLRSWASHLVNNVIHDVIQREYKGQHLFRDVQEVESTWEATYSAAHSSPRGSPNRTPSFSEFCSFSQSEDVEANILEELAVYNIHARSSAPHADKLTENSPRAQTGAHCDSRLLVSDGLVARTRADVNASPSRDSDGQLNEDENTAVSMQERKALWEEKLSWKRGHDVTKHVTDVGGGSGGLKRTKQILEENLNVSSDSSNGTSNCDRSVDLGLDGSHNVQQTKQMWQELATQKTSPEKPVNGHCSPNKSPDRTESSNQMQLKLQQWENYQENIGSSPESPRENDLGSQLYEHDEDKIDISNEHMSSFVFSTSIRNVKQTKSKWETLMADASPEADIPDSPREDVVQPPAPATKSTSFIRGTKFASLKNQWQQK